MNGVIMNDFQSDHELFEQALTGWFATNQRDLPWRRQWVTPWGVMVSEFMLQQTPVVRVLGPWAEWMKRWPEPFDLAAEPTGQAVAAWGSLGYPRRALRLHASAVAITEKFGGQVPSNVVDLRSLPGVGEYTAAAIACFAFGADETVLDTNIRRVFARAMSGRQYPGDHVLVEERLLGLAWLPRGRAKLWNTALMELGAICCVARQPLCDQCPVAHMCRWRANGYPAHQGKPRQGQAWAGTDRQCRGQILAEVRRLTAAGQAWARRSDLLTIAGGHEQAERCLAGLLKDGLLHEEPAGIRL
jgi:A/G-specific adenine glycosylase